MKRVCIINNPLNSKVREFVEVDDVHEYIKAQFGKFPETVRIYHEDIALACDVTPCNRRSFRHMKNLDGDFYVVNYAGYDPVTIAYLVVMALVAAFSVYTIMTMPKPQVSAAQSANNDLASRQNQARLGGRIPEIFGTVRAYPDLIAATYVFYNDQDKEIEVSLMVLGRGYYDIHDCREDTTDVHDIAGYKVSVYDPHTSILGDPIYQVGDKFDYYPPMTMKSKSINGQTIDVPNDQKIESDEIYFEYPNLIKSRGQTNFTTMFVNRDNIGIYGADFGVEDVQWSGNALFTAERRIVIETTENIINPNDFQGVLLTGAFIEIIGTVPPVEEGGEPTQTTTYRDISGQYKVQGVSKTTLQSGFQYVITLANAMTVNSNWQYIDSDKTAIAGIKLNNNANAINLNGSYQISGVTSSQIELNSPDQVNQDWVKLLSLPRQSTVDQLRSVRLDKLDNRWVGWHNLVMPETEEIVFNFFFQNGLFYQDSKGGVWGESMRVLIEYQHINDANQPIGDIFKKIQLISKESKSPFGTTIRIKLDKSGPVRFRVARTTPTKNGKSQDLCKVKDVYALSSNKKINYGDVTVIRLESSGTEGALSLKEKKLNLLSSRRLPVDGTGPLVATRDAGQALIYLALDDKNGRRSVNEVDIAQIKSEVQAVKQYFRSDKAAEFSYTIDDPNMSFEEIVGMISSTIFCEPYRFGSKLRLKFEKPQEIAALLFNHRNKAPLSETRTFSQTIEKNYDGIELEYTDPFDDARIKYHIYFDRSRNQAFEGEGALNALTIKTSGIRTHEQAKTRAWREWNKLQYRRLTVKFDALDESNLLARNDKIIVADNTRLTTQDGEVETALGLTLILSQEVDMRTNWAYKIFLQMHDGTVDMIPCQQTGFNQVTLTRPPKMALVTGYDRYACTTYQIVQAADENSTAMMLTEMEPNGRMLNTVTATNYTDQYYEKDHSFF